VEDLPGFNGAGLYSSEPLKMAQDGEKVATFASRERIEEAIKKVYLSVWSKRYGTISFSHFPHFRFVFP
jgi:hypothetical protein